MTESTRRVHVGRMNVSGQAKTMGDGTGYWLMGLDHAAYRCEPCGHRFDRDGQLLPTG